MARTAADYADLLLRLCPESVRGLWSRMHATLLSFVSAKGAELARIEGRADDALEEAFPGTAEETIEAWEEQLGIDDPPATLAERQAYCVAKFRGRGGPQVAAYIRTVCEGFGYAAASVTITEPASALVAFRCGVGACGDPIGGGGAEAHSFLVTYPAPTNAELEELITAIKPVHTTAYFATV
jgi:uncharacterized protein YmfQ (DUF2313 family)